MNVKKGLATWAGLVAACGQYAAAVAVFLEADNQSDALGPLVTATATLLAVIVGRMQQAKAAIQKPTPQPLSFSTGTTGGYSNVTFTPLRRIDQDYAPAPGRPGEFDDEPAPPPDAELRDLHENDET
jgi:hypothetical protein